MKASSFLLEPSLTPKLFETLARRYAERPGGYTRIHKFGHRPGDNAPHAVLELVDGPRDLRLEMAARAAGWDILSSRLKKTNSSSSSSSSSSPRALVEGGLKDVEETIERERALALAENAEGGGKGKGEGASELRQRTRWNLRKALRYRSSEDVKRFGDKVQEHMDTLLARPVAVKALRERSEKRESGSGESDQEYFRSIKDYKLKAGETVPGASGSALRRAQADLGWVPGRKVRWFERRKLGIDRPLTWEQV